MEDVKQLRTDLAAAFRCAVRFGLNEGISNHFSVALEDDTFLINPHGLHWSEITASNLLVCDAEGKRLAKRDYAESIVQLRDRGLDQDGLLGTLPALPRPALL